MTSSEKDISKSQITGKNIHEESNTCEDEINLIDYFRVLWKRKYFILLAAILPAMIAGIFFFILPQNYKVTYVYDAKSDANLPKDVEGWKLNEKNYNLLIDNFYSEENLNRVTDSLRKDGFKEYAEQIGRNNNTPGKFIQFEVAPPFLNVPTPKITSPDQIRQIRDMKALLLKVTVVGRPKESMHKMSYVIRDNIENVIPLYGIQGQLTTSIMNYNNLLADIERNRFNLELSLKKINKVLASLKEVNVRMPANKQDNIALQFNVGEQGQYLPLDYQIQAAESKKIELEESIKANEEYYKYYKDLLNLNNRILAKLDSSKPTSEYSGKQFKAFLNDLAAGCEKQEMKDYLNSYIRRIDNRIMAYKPVTEKPWIHPIAKGTVKKSGIVFVMAFVMAVFAAFLCKKRTEVTN